jgi:hypothetical protein
MLTLQPRLKKLRQLLAIGDMAAEEIFFEIQEALRALDPKAERQLTRAFVVLDFKKALALITELEKTIKEEGEDNA